MRALVLSGGGANGAYQAGAIQYLLGERRIRYDMICGTSVGALNGAALAQFAAGEEPEAADFVAGIWDGIQGDDSIYQKWAHGLLWHLPVLWHQSIFDSSPLAETVRGKLSASKLIGSGKSLRVVAVAWGSGQAQVWKETDPDIVDGVLASSSFPLFFAPVRARGVQWTDGGLREITPLREAIKLGATRIDIITCSPRGVSAEVGGRIGKLEQLRRSQEIMLDEIAANDVARALDKNKLVTVGMEPGKRVIDIHLMEPAFPLGDSLDFTPLKNRRLMDQGEFQAARLDW